MLKNIGKASGRMLTRSQIGLFSSKDLVVQHDPKNLTFFVELNSDKAFLEYTKENGVFNLKHTFVPEVFKGKQIGNLLAKVGFDYFDLIFLTFHFFIGSRRLLIISVIVEVKQRLNAHFCITI